MSDIPLRVGQAVPDLVFDTYEPATGEFRDFSMARQREARRWTILFFYPADFTGL